MSKFDFQTRVYYDNTDAGGVVYHSKYMDICERARTEFLRSKGIIQSKLAKETGIGFVVRKASMEYKKSAKLDDLLNITTEVIANNGILLVLRQEIFLTYRENISVDNEQLFTLDVELVCINKDGKLTRIPKDISFILIN